MKTERFLAFRFCQTFEHEICVPYFKFFTSIPIVFISLNNFVSGWKEKIVHAQVALGPKCCNFIRIFFFFFGFHDIFLS